LYRALSSRYGWTPDVIANLTIDQQIMYASDDEEDSSTLTTNKKTGKQMLSFRDEKAYLEYFRGKT
jgi:hypothetical protein